MYVGDIDDPPVPTLCGMKLGDDAAETCVHKWADVTCAGCLKRKDEIVYWAIGPGCWGKGKTPELAKRYMREANGKGHKLGKLKSWTVYKTGPTAYMTGMGGLNYKTTDVKPVVVEDVKA